MLTISLRSQSWDREQALRIDVQLMRAHGAAACNSNAATEQPLQREGPAATVP